MFLLTSKAVKTQGEAFSTVLELNSIYPEVVGSAHCKIYSCLELSDDESVMSDDDTSFSIHVDPIVLEDAHPLLHAESSQLSLLGTDSFLPFLPLIYSLCSPACTYSQTWEGRLLLATL